MRIGRPSINDSFKCGSGWEMFQSTKPTVRPDGTALVADDKWYDTSDNFWYFWNGTYWLSEDIYHATFTQAASISTSTTYIGILGSNSSYNYYLLDYNFSGLLSATMNASNYWTLAFARLDAGTGGAGPTLSTFTLNTYNFTSGFNAVTLTNSLNLHQDLTALNPAIYRIITTPTGTPGALSQFVFRVRYRLAKP